MIMAAVFSLGVGCAAAIFRIGGTLVARERAQIAADAVALGGIYDEQLAFKIAGLHGAELIRFVDRRADDGTVETIVRIGTMTRAAQAFDSWYEATPTLEP
jgi:hypothetical protein